MKFEVLGRIHELGLGFVEKQEDGEERRENVEFRKRKKIRE